MYEGPAYIHNEVNLTNEDQHHRRFSTLVAIDPDTRGAGVAIVHDFANRTPEGHAARSQVHVFTLAATTRGARSFIDGRSLARCVHDATLVDGVSVPLQPGINGTVDFVVEIGHAHGAFNAGVNIGIVAGVCQASLHDQDERYASTAFLSPNTWVSGLFGDGYRAKAQRVGVASAFAPPEIQAAIAQCAGVLRDSRLAESIADATAMAWWTYHRAWDEACMATFPRLPRDVIRLQTEVENERHAPYRALFSTLTKEDLLKMLGRLEDGRTGARELSRDALAARARASVQDVEDHFNDAADL